MHNGRLTVMQLISNLDIGGAQEVVRTLAENLKQSGCSTVVCTFKDGPLRHDIERLGIPVEVVPDRRYSIVALPRFIRDMWRIRQALAEIIRKYRVDVVQTHLLNSLDFLVLTLRWRTHLLVFWTVQNANFTLRADQLPRYKWLLGPKRTAYRLLYRLAARWIHGFIAVSDDVKTAILQTIGSIPPEKISIICNSVDVRRYQRHIDRSTIGNALGLPESAPVVAVVATFKTQKGHRHLIEATPTVLSEFPNLHILLIGDGELREELQDQAKAMGLSEHIHFLGSRADVPELLAASDYFVLPSLWEGLSMALVEAMATGLPVIATDVSGTNQVMIAGETGLLVPPGDSQRLAEAMIWMLSNPEPARDMATAAQQRVACYFGADKQAADHITLYRRMAGVAEQ